MLWKPLFRVTCSPLLFPASHDVFCNAFTMWLPSNNCNSSVQRERLCNQTSTTTCYHELCETECSSWWMETVDSLLCNRVDPLSKHFARDTRNSFFDSHRWWFHLLAVEKSIRNFEFVTFPDCFKRNLFKHLFTKSTTKKFLLHNFLLVPQRHQICNT